MKIRVSLLAFAGAFGIASALAGAKAANMISINYYTIASNDPDPNHLAGGLFTNEVQTALGPSGLPVLNIPQFGCTSNCYSVAGAPGFPSGGTTPNANVNALTGEITYWSPSSNPFVTQTSSTTTSLPFSAPSNFFPPDGTGTAGDGGTSGYQAAHLFGTITAASTETLSFNIGSDDAAFAYIDGNVVCDDGGLHPSASVACTTPTVSAGTHSFDLFFADLNQSQSGLTFSISTSDVTTGPGGGNSGGGTSTPEPGSLAILVTAVGLGIAEASYRRGRARTRSMNA